MTKIKLIIFSIIPVLNWFFLYFGLIFRVFNGMIFNFISNIFLNIFFYFFFSGLIIIIHEFGHFLSAKIVGETPVYVELGGGIKILSFKLGKTEFIINSDLANGGGVYTFYTIYKNLKIRYFFVVFGGVLSTIIFCLTVFLIFGFNYLIFLGKIVDIPTIFIIVSLIDIFRNLKPHSFYRKGIETKNDGLKILELLSTKVVDLKSYFAEILVLNKASENFKNKTYDKALEMYSINFKSDELKCDALIVKSHIYEIKGEYQNAIDSLNSILNLVEPKIYKSYSPIIYNNLAWYYFLVKDLQNADIYSKKAFDIVKHFYVIRGTRGAILIENGKIKEGIEILENIVDFQLVDSFILSASCFLCYGYHKLENKKKSDKYLKFITKNFSQMDTEDKIIWNNLLSKMGKNEN